jgi:hypothetical protein
VLLNNDWSHNSQVKFFCAQALAGAILINERNNQAVILNCVEVYGRTKSVDHHREPFGLIKGVPTRTSLPEEDTRYPNVLPLTVNDVDGAKLVIGTQTFNALVTSSLRIDANANPIIGATTCSFMLPNKEDSKTTKIYLDGESLKKALSLISKEENTNFIEPYHLLYQLRQIRSKFHRRSTYFLCRASGGITKNHTYQPYTIFTVCDYDRGEDSDGKMASKLFRSIALKALKDSEPKLERQIVENTNANVKKMVKSASYWVRYYRCIRI